MTRCQYDVPKLASSWRRTGRTRRCPNGTVLCANWPGIPTEPCETVEGVSHLMHATLGI
jgi:hypothetical protein